MPSHVTNTWITPDQATVLLDELEARPRPADSQQNPGEKRYRYRFYNGLTAELEHPGGSVRECKVFPRDLSVNRITLLVGSFLHTETRCLVTLPTVDGETVMVPGKVSRCAHVRGNAHEADIEFDLALDLNNHIAELSKVSEPEEEDKPPTFSAKVLYVEDAIDDRELACFLLERLGVEVHATSDASEALAMATKIPFDMVLISMELEGQTGPRIADLLSDGFCPGPFVACSTNESPQAKIDALASGFVTVLPKPYGLDDFVELLEQHLPSEPAPESKIEPLFSSKWGDEPMRPLILGFLERLEGKVRRMQELLAERNTTALGKLCRELKGSAGGYGYEQIGELGRDLERIIAEGDQSQVFRTKFDKLISACTAACQVRAQASAA